MADDGDETAGKHTTKAYGYDVIASKCANQHQGGVAFLLRTSQSWHMESVRTFGNNVIRGTLVHNDRRTTIVGAYISPSKTDLSTIGYIDTAMSNIDTEETILLGDFNIRLHQSKDSRGDEIVENILSYNLGDISKRFKP